MKGFEHEGTSREDRGRTAASVNNFTEAGGIEFQGCTHQVGWKHALESGKRAAHSEGRVVTDGLEIKQALVTLTEESNQMGPKRRQYKERRKKNSCK